MRTVSVVLGAVGVCLALAVPGHTRAAEVDAPKRPAVYRIGINSAWAPNIREETMRRWAFGTGATMPRVGMSLALVRQYPDHADNWVRDFVGKGRTALGFLMNGEAAHSLPDGKTESGMKPPEGLWEPVFTNGTDTAGKGAALNPKNEWAWFIGTMVARYRGEGDGSLRVTYFSMWNEPDWLPWPERPKSAEQMTLKNW